ncbi:hypothetical protein [Vibrio europaeus]|uniref:Uncharacterized protein n=1 Tax=Vibrio europaeus TaxID=300876 RepID=A0A178J575_9VIBR|nr:hypothetical protein [Vibrio europaeus]MDC5706159.1 hypothetical protein [Vibrio europaeus]MDC5709569.1 hypothetical protein [Vibrio europaeus]MDC5713968.1 hypothetical protein [Vibrio europaeus]MDC5723423.1 hypothetical protein [Vibrio europaeus]MDC5730560.1 hypothetical protein [Vibrio europaeus]
MSQSDISEESVPIEGGNKGGVLVYLVPPYIFACTLGAIWLLIDGWVTNFASISSLWALDKDHTLPNIVVALLFTQVGAVLGGSLLAIVSFHRYQAIEKAFDKDHLWGFMFSPLLALIIGTLAFAIIQSGLVVLAGGFAAKDHYTATLGYLSIGGIAGYNWDVFIKKLKDLSNNVTTTEQQT